MSLEDYFNNNLLHRYLCHQNHSLNNIYLVMNNVILYLMLAHYVYIRLPPVACV